MLKIKKKMKIILALFLLFLAASFTWAQVEKHSWLPIILSDGEKIWYDVSGPDTTGGDKLDFWILEEIGRAHV